jgi:putative DNA primase/helicase
MEDYAKLCFNCNNLPADIEHSRAYFRRFVILPFRVTIPENERDTELSKKIIEKELSGVFNWVLLGLERLLRNRGLTESKIVSEVVTKFQNDADSVCQFLEENTFIKSKDKFESLKDLYFNYRGFCVLDGYKSLNKRNFKRRLELRGFDIKRKSCGNVVFLEESSKKPKQTKLV